eukprot:gnl/MRDRNA2_/MRDRNA2_64451_c0_seq1.p1 gnl/MRDRNA2_/MRDRNA2_64451_c0~~gnl/MRDRNA2_/MRDRNA2_64451_c0_seq1.p1  ORF type:complete len:394 (-),score=94.92 gnl/MRDRNA2_/MRDRNA2_64451_c0_seq1:167-1348(-)
MSIANQLKDRFHECDTTGDGLISEEELKAVYMQLGAWSDAEFDVLFKEADLNQDGVLNYEEFVDWVLDDQHHEVLEHHKEHVKPHHHKRKHACKPHMLHEEELATADHLWEALLGMGSHLCMEDLASLFDQAWKTGLHKTFPHATVERVPPPTTSQVVAIVRELGKNLKVSKSELIKVMDSAPKYPPQLPPGQHPEEEHVDLFQFRALFPNLAAFMQVDPQEIISHLIWVQKSRFELTEAQFDKVIAYLRGNRKHSRKIGDEEKVIDGSDFELLCRHGGIHQKHSTGGHDHKHTMSVAKCSAAFDHVMQHIDELVKERAKTHPGLDKKAHFSKHRHRLRNQGNGAGVVGRTEMSILITEFWKEMPCPFVSPLIFAAVLAQDTSATIIAEEEKL